MFVKYSTVDFNVNIAYTEPIFSLKPNCKESVFNASPQIADKTISNNLDMTGDRVIPR